jgi:hypothetical protein
LIPGASAPILDNPTPDEIHQFWSHVIDLSCVDFIQENYWESVAQMTRDVELVVIARPQSVRYTADPVYRDSPIVRFTIDQVLKGGPVTLQDGTMQLAVDQDELESIDEVPIPAVPTLLFLRNMAVGRSDWYVPGGPDPSTLYYLPTTYQNVMVNRDGHVFLPMEQRMRAWLGSETWPLELQGTSFDKVVEQVQRAVTQGDRGDGVRAHQAFAC